jgi:TPR repeat protein
VPQNYAEALEWFHKAADQGNAKAQHDLGASYFQGHAADTNYAEALKWFRKAADQGNAEDQYIVGAMYENGQGVAQNYTEALRWYRTAADQGNSEARANLTVLYSRFPGLRSGPNPDRTSIAQAPPSEASAQPRVDKLSVPAEAKNVMDLFNIALMKVESENNAYCLKSAQLACSMHMMATNTCPQIVPNLYKIFATLDALERQGMTPNQAARQIRSVLAEEAAEVPEEERVRFAWRAFMACLETADQ